MGLRAEFALHHSGCEAFLFAPLWQEANGSALSVLSALARLGMDPWKEAAVLARQPREAAAASLAATLARLPKTAEHTVNYAELADRVVGLLPSQASGRIDLADRKNENGSLPAFIPILIALGVLTALVLMRGWPF